MKFTEAQLEAAIIELLKAEGYPHVPGGAIDRQPQEVLIKADLRAFLARQYAADGITPVEIESVIRKLEAYSAADLYGSNKATMKLVSDGFLLKREDRDQKDLYVQLIDYSELAAFREPKAGEVPLIVAEEVAVYQTGGNIFKMVNQMEIIGYEKRIPDGILYINGLPLVVFEFKSAIREEATIHDAFGQLTVRYKRDIPELFKYNAFCVISDGVNNKAGSFFAGYEFFYAWRKTDGNDLIEKDGIDSLYSMIRGLFHPTRLCDVIRNFIYLPDNSRQEKKILCRYPQYYAATKLYQNILQHMRPEGDGKGGTYFGATGCGKSFTMLFLTRLLMKSVALSSPTIVLITDRTDLDDQLSGLFTDGKGYIGDESVISVESRTQLRELLKGRNSGGVFLTTIHKFTQDTELLTKRNNVICISDEAHRSQVNLDQKVKITKEGVVRTFGFAKYLHDSLPNATYVGFTGTPIDATLDVFGEVVDAYTMTESVADEITVRIVYEGRAARVLLDNGKLAQIEDYYAQCADNGANDYAIESSKRANLQMTAILGDPDRLKALAADFVDHYEARINEGATIAGKAMFVSSSRPIAYDFYKEVIALRPEWAQLKICADGEKLTEQEKKQIMPMERIKLVMTRGQDDEPALYDMLGTKEYREKLAKQFKTPESNFKIAVVVDMWLTGFDVPFLNSMYIDKPVKRHNLIQTISRVNRKCLQKEKGLIIDYIGIKKQMNLALAHYAKADTANFEDVKQSIVVVRDHLDLMRAIFHKFDSTLYFFGQPMEQLHCLNMAAEYVQITGDLEKRFMFLSKRMKAAYDICVGCDEFVQEERDHVHFYLAVRSIIFKLTRGDAPDLAQMNARVQQMIAKALQSDGVEEILKIGQGDIAEVDIFDPDYMAKIEKIKLPNTRIKLLQQLLAKAIEAFKKVNKLKGVDFSKQFKALVDKYNDRSEQDTLESKVLEDFTDEIIDLYHAIKKEKESFAELGIDFKEKSFYDILKTLTIKYDFQYPEDKLLDLAKKVKVIVDDKARYTDWSQRVDIKAELKADLIILLAESGYPPVDRDEVYKKIFEQAENFKKYQV
ncbi:type I restriction endonuclease subunit R [Desulfobacula toluolica]|uniref:Type I restriction enzyme endonuclease subunit n=1 Tax=Desulfobacula toluolica (strain DSM 7467 / Tol2) TaxID=651182 RepID=K0NSD0_DESTT|nr:HsdR family type I site-specific deoxyribonuclease [Desulfobacula toluolica]CCK81887.1 HsdR2: type I site-specific deoxyribonuclease [Desulfobacula toluolica Tol2]